MKLDEQKKLEMKYDLARVFAVQFPSEKRLELNALMLQNVSLYPINQLDQRINTWMNRFLEIVLEEDLCDEWDDRVREHETFIALIERANEKVRQFQDVFNRLSMSDLGNLDRCKEFSNELEALLENK